MRSVLLPVDGSRHAFAAALYLIDFASLHGAPEVHVVNVEPPPVLWQTHGMESEAIQSHLAVQAHIAMNPVLNALNEAGVAHHSYVKVGDTAETIVALADELGCDTIVMGTRGMGGLAALALGSVTRKVLHLTKVPVVCIKDTTN
jgi:nucleotide-binding universal stress UspA family protein